MWEFVFLALLYLVGSVLFFHGKDSGPSLVWPGWKLPFQGADLKQKALARTGCIDFIKVNKSGLTLIKGKYQSPD